jgi:phosphoglycolate phosphatase-like HAD superfamily hydrolase
MFDIDGTLVNSEAFDSNLYIEAIEEATGLKVDDNWSRYKHVTDTGILSELFEENSLSENTSDLVKKTKNLFISKVEKYLNMNPLLQITGAINFIEYLLQRNDVRIAIATGGWLETAELKLEKAGFNTNTLQISSANDHESRTQIMKIAQSRTNTRGFQKITYFGDAIWDKKACEELGYNFVLVGNSIEAEQQINDFSSHSDVIRFIDL